MSLPSWPIDKLGRIRYAKHLFKMDNIFHTFSRIWKRLNKFFTTLYTHPIIPSNYLRTPVYFFLLRNFYSLSIFNYGIIRFVIKTLLQFDSSLKNFTKNFFSSFYSSIRCLLANEKRNWSDFEKVMAQIHALTGKNRFENWIIHVTQY